MFIIRRFSPYIIGVLCFLGFFLISYWPSGIWLVFVFLNLCLALVIVASFDKKINLDTVHYFLTPILLLWSVFLFFLFLENIYVKLAIAALSGFFMFVYMEQLFFYRFAPKRYQAKALENLTMYLSVVTLFFAASGLFGFYIFLHAPRYLLLLAIIVLGMALNYHLFWILKINFWESLPYIGVMALATFEFFYVMTFLPTSFAVNGAILAILYYLALGMIRYHFLDSLDSRVIKRHLIIGLVILISVIATARWT